MKQGLDRNNRQERQERQDFIFLGEKPKAGDKVSTAKVFRVKTKTRTPGNSVWNDIVVSVVPIFLKLTDFCWVMVGA
ncbi:MAG: hypothetical protein DRI56_13270 [Chloroflexota bacterium]|nr:MAG: hypothetical protein DRI56_13270 [Chloroflexota bacterium]